MCLVALSFLAWVVVLKARVDSLERENARLKEALEQKLARVSGDIEVGRGQRLTSSEFASNQPPGMTRASW
jgi:hypothetical protein